MAGFEPGSSGRQAAAVTVAPQMFRKENIFSKTTRGGGKTGLKRLLSKSKMTKLRLG